LGKNDELVPKLIIWKCPIHNKRVATKSRTEKNLSGVLMSVGLLYFVRMKDQFCTIIPQKNLKGFLGWILKLVVYPRHIKKK
jgi:hypothetical protein